MGQEAKSPKSLIQGVTMLTIKLSKAQFELLREVIEKRAPKLLVILRSGCKVVLERDIRWQIQDILGDELMEEGVDESGEINERGIALDDLIDEFSPYKDP